MIRLNWPSGVFPSVALSNGLGWLAVREGDPRQPGALVVYEWTGTDLAGAQEWRRWSLMGGSPAFPSLYAFEGLIWLAYHDGFRLQLRNLTAGTLRPFDGLSNPVAFGAGFFAYCEPAKPYRVIRLDLRTGEVTQPRLGAPTGLSRILPDGRIVTIDEDRLSLPGATIPSFAGPLAVGEGPNGGVRWMANGVEDLLWFPLDSFTPKCAVDGARWAITTAGSGTVRLFCGTVEELHRASVPPPIVNPPVVNPPVPVPPPIPEPVHMRLPDGVQQIVTALYTQHLDLANGTDDQRRALTQLIIEQVCFTYPNDGWVWKSAEPGRPLSKDSIAKQQDGRLLNFDLFDGTTRTPNDHPESEDITGQTPRPWPGVDHLGGIPAPTPFPVPEPHPAPEPTPGPPPVTLDAIFNALAGVQFKLDALIAEVHAVKGQSFTGTGTLFGQTVTFTLAPKG